jgi:ABC-2 type transport system permease protein
MFSLLRIEWMKLKNYRAFWVFAIGFLALYPLILYSVHRVFKTETHNQDTLEMFARTLMGDPLRYPGFWHFSAYCGGFLIILLGLITIMHTCNEYNYKTHRQNIIDGWSRKQFIMGKLVLIFALSLLATLWYALMTIGYGAIAISNKSEMFNPNGLVFIFYYFIECMVYMTCALMIGVLLRRAGLAIGLYFIYAYIIDNLLFITLIKDWKVARFLPLDAADSLINNQILQAEGVFKIDNALRMGLLITCIVYIIIYITVSYLRFSKKDL